MKKWILILISVIPFLLHGETQYRFKGELSFESAIGIWEDPRWVEGCSTLEGSMNIRSEEWDFLVQGELQYDLQEVYSWDLGELYIQWDTRAGRWTLGRQRIRWGQSLALPVLDIISPADQRNLFSGLEEAPVLPVEGLKWQYGFDNAQIELIYLRGYQETLFPRSAQLSQPLSIVEDSPKGYSWDEGEWGGRLRLFLPLGDLGFMGFYGWEDTPLGRIEMIQGDAGPEPALALHVERSILLGWDGAIPLGAFLLRLENGHYLNRKFQRESLMGDFIETYQISALIGLDWIQDDWTVVVETQGEWIPENPQDIGIDPFSVVSAMKVERLLDYGLWQLGLSIMGNWETHQIYIEPSLIHKPSDGLDVSLGGFWLSNGEDSPFDGDSRIFLRCSLAL